MNAFVADDVEMQREQFLRINSTKPLPRGLITEILPEVSTVLPCNSAAGRVPSALCEMLNRHPGSPFRGLIRRASEPGVNETQGHCLGYNARPGHPGQPHVADGMPLPLSERRNWGDRFTVLECVLLTYWNAVKDTFPGRVGPSSEAKPADAQCGASCHGTAHGSSDGVDRRRPRSMRPR